MCSVRRSLTSECALQCGDCGVAFTVVEGDTLAKQGHSDDGALRCVSDERSYPMCLRKQQDAGLFGRADGVACCIESARRGRKRKRTSPTQNW